MYHVTGYAFCQSQVYSCKDTFKSITYEFVGGNIYALISDFGRGSWGLATCLGGTGEIIDGDILLNDQKISPVHLAKVSCFLGKTDFNELEFLKESESAKNCIQEALTISELPYSVTDIKHMFGLSNERFERDIKYVSGEIWRITAAIGFALDKQIFIYPWMNTHDALSIDPEIADVLRENKKIVLFPGCRALLKSPLTKKFDNIINFHRFDKPYFNIPSDDLKKYKKMRKWW